MDTGDDMERTAIGFAMAWGRGDVGGMTALTVGADRARLIMSFADLAWHLAERLGRAEEPPVGPEEVLRGVALALEED